MAGNFRVIDHSDLVFKQLDANALRFVEQLKPALVEAVQEKILYGYSTPHGADGHTEIVETGALYDSITADAQKVSQNVYTASVGVEASSPAAKYAGYVHDGTWKLEGRPFVTDALLDETTKEKVSEIAGKTLPVGFS